MDQRRGYFFRILLTFLLVQLVMSVFAYDPNMKENQTLSHTQPNELKGVGVQDRTGIKVDLSLKFKDENGDEVTLANYFGRKPVILTLVYFECPSLCNYHLNGMVKTLKEMKSKMGEDYNFIAVSIDPNETPLLAAEKKDSYIEALGAAGNPEGWHFLTTDSEENIKSLAKQVGFEYKWIEETKQYSHAAVAYIMTPEGVISRYMYGIEFSAETLRLSIIEASNGKLGTVVDRFILFCFQFNPNKNKYTLYAFNLMRLVALILVIGLAVVLVPLWLKEKQSKTTIKGEN